MFNHQPPRSPVAVLLDILRDIALVVVGTIIAMVVLAYFI